MEALKYTEPQPTLKKVSKCLDTLAQLAPNPEENLLKKAKRKALTVFLSTKLIELNSINIKAYRNMYYCNSVLQQENQELKTSYCKSRFCLVCNSIKTANLINGYLPELQKLKEPHFMTLTIKAVKARYLRAAINQMQKDFRAITKSLSKYRNIRVIGIRKLECNYNEKTKTYNPHFHIIMDGLYEAAHLLNLWLDMNPRSNQKGQDIEPADINSMKELFKYATKVISKSNKINAKSLDVIFSCLHRKRVIQPMGIKKYVDEDEREKVTYSQLPNESTIWDWNEVHNDWFNVKTGESLTGFIPDKELKTLFKDSEISKESFIELLE